MEYQYFITSLYTNMSEWFDLVTESPLFRQGNNFYGYKTGKTFGMFHAFFMLLPAEEMGNEMDAHVNYIREAFSEIAEKVEGGYGSY